MVVRIHAREIFSHFIVIPPPQIYLDKFKGRCCHTQKKQNFALDPQKMYLGCKNSLGYPLVFLGVLGFAE